MAGQETNQTNKENEKGGMQEKNNKKVITILVAALIFVVVVAGIIIFALANSGDTDQANEQRPVVINEDNVEDVLDDMLSEDESIPQNYTISMTTEWTFADGTAKSPDAYVQNLATNDTPVYFDIYRQDTGEIIYESPVIPLGEYIDNIQLDKALEAGTHNCVMTYHLIDDDQNTLTTVSMELFITVLE